MEPRACPGSGRISQHHIQNHREDGGVGGKPMKTRVAPAAVLLMVVGTRAPAVNIETVTVGNPGNPDDVHGYGGVGYTFDMGKFEITAGQYTEFLNAVAGTDSYGLYNICMDYDAGPGMEGCNIQRTGSPGSYTYSVAADWANRPVNLVSWGDAARFANWLHNGQPTGAQDLSTTEDGSYYINGATGDSELLSVTRKANATWVIPSEDEWYKAAYYDGPNNAYYDYPTGTDTAPSNDVIGPDPGNNANYYDDDYPDGYTTGMPYYRTPVGEFENSESPYGTFDQGGNVEEWNEAIAVGCYRGLRGGSYYDSVFGEVIYLCASNRDYIFPTYDGSTRGFRVAYVPEPTTLGALIFGGFALLRRRRVQRWPDRAEQTRQPRGISLRASAVGLPACPVRQIRSRTSPTSPNSFRRLVLKLPLPLPSPDFFIAWQTARQWVETGRVEQVQSPRFKTPRVLCNPAFAASLSMSPPNPLRASKILNSA